MDYLQIIQKESDIKYQTIDRVFFANDTKKAIFAPSNAIDLGLPSGNLWCDRNIGADSPTSEGLFFSYGDTQGYEYSINHVFSQSTDKWYDSSTSSYTKYNNTDKKNTLDLEDDAAYVNMGSEWRMPTANDCTELIAYTTINVINDMYFKFANKKDPTRFIIFPSSGIWSGRLMVNNCLFLSSTLYDASSCCYIAPNWVTPTSNVLNYRRSSAFQVRGIVKKTS